jgi:DNA-binding IclR family transcriptional regulator
MIQVLNRAFNILEQLASERDREFGLREIADNHGLNHGTCANILKTMISREYVEQIDKRGGYRLGSKVYYLTENFQFKEEILSVSVDLMKALVKKLNEGVILVVVHSNKRIIIHEEQGTNELQVVNRKEKEIYKTSTGRMIIACKSRIEQEEFIRKYGLPDKEDWPEIETEEDLIKELASVRKKKLVKQMSKPSNIIGLAVPIFIRNKIVASMGVYLPKYRFTKEMQNNILHELPDAADRITKQLDLKQSIRDNQ